jgi:hypothetical protein
MSVAVREKLDIYGRHRDALQWSQQPGIAGADEARAIQISDAIE